VDIRQLTPGDIDAVLRLCSLAGWNQTGQDIRRLVALEPQGCFAACGAGRVIGTVTTTTYGTDVGWVGMVLVDPEFRRRGIATALMRTAMEYLRARQVITIKLDATPAGRVVYERLGFVPEGLLERWAGELTHVRMEDSATGTWEDIATIDRAAFGVDRGALLRLVIADAGRAPLIARDERGEIGGFALARLGALADYVGPVIADDPATARALLSAVAARCGGLSFIDINTDFPGASDLVRDLGFTRQRELLRMRLGPDEHVGRSRRVFAIAGPEVG
jgi:GNAT superfamily N-acetyltransferase